MGRCIRVSTALHNWRARQEKSGIEYPHANLSQAELREFLARHRAEKEAAKKVVVSPTLTIAVIPAKAKWGKGGSRSVAAILRKVA